MMIRFKYAFSFTGPVYLSVPTTQLFSYYPHLDINSAVSVKDVGLAPTSLQLVNNAGQISLPLYAPAYNQKQLVPSVKTADQYSMIIPVTFTNKVNLILFSKECRFCNCNIYIIMCVLFNCDI